MAGNDLRLLVFQHIDIEHPGVFRNFLRDDGIEWDAVELDAGEPIPSLDDYDALWVMGGPMDVWETERHPWLEAEKAAIREAVVARRLPFLGVCLGHQLLAVALGGEVGPAKTPEIGVLDVEMTESGARSPFLAGFPSTMTTLQWHGAEVKRAPAGAEVLAATPACAVQAMSIGETALSVQYHMEITPSTVPEWGAVPAYKAALERTLGPGALEELEAAARAHMAGFNRDARRLYDNWMSAALGQTARASAAESRD